MGIKLWGFADSCWVLVVRGQSGGGNSRVGFWLPRTLNPNPQPCAELGGSSSSSELFQDLGFWA